MGGIRIFQILVPLVALLFLSASFSRYRRGKLNLAELMVTCVIWVSIGVFSVFPDRISFFIARLFGFENNVNAVIFFGLGALFFVQFKMYSIIKRQQRDITRLSRDIALRDYQKEKE